MMKGILQNPEKDQGNVIARTNQGREAAEKDMEVVETDMAVIKKNLVAREDASGFIRRNRNESILKYYFENNFILKSFDSK